MIILHTFTYTNEMGLYQNLTERVKSRKMEEETQHMPDALIRRIVLHYGLVLTGYSLMKFIASLWIVKIYSSVVLDLGL